MRLALLAAAVVAGAWLLLRRRATRDRVVVAWTDGSELELRSGSPEGARLVDIARGVLR